MAQLGRKDNLFTVSFLIFIKWHWNLNIHDLSTYFLGEKRSFENIDLIKTFPCQRKNFVEQKKGRL